jgi:hypothetical protein
VPKVQHKPIKRSKLGSKRKEQKKSKRTLVWRTGLSGVPPDSVRCTRVDRHQTLHLQVSPGALRYNSPDCSVRHRTVWCVTGLSDAPSGATTINATVDCTVPSQSYSSRQKSEQAPEAHRTLNSSCPVRHWTIRCPKLSELQRSKSSEP